MLHTADIKKNFFIDQIFFKYNFSHPIDVVKTRLQVSGDGGRNYKALGITGTVSVIATEEGISAFWKGIGAGKCNLFNIVYRRYIYLVWNFFW